LIGSLSGLVAQFASMGTQNNPYPPRTTVFWVDTISESKARCDA
jgi:hypothetical protein